MWSSQLPALLEKREKKKEGRNRGAGQSCRTFMFAVPNLRFLGPQALCVGGAEPRLSGAQHSCSQLWGRLSVGTAVPLQQWWLARGRAPLCPVSQWPAARARLGPLREPVPGFREGTGPVSPTRSPTSETVDKAAFLISSLRLPCGR